MKIINYVSLLAIPLVIIVIVWVGTAEKQKVYDIFIDGVKEGMQIIINIFPTLLGLFVAIGALRSSGILELITNLIKPVLDLVGVPSEIIPLAIVRPISGSASTAVATDIMKNFGVDSKIGLIASTIMGSTETTFYTIAVYTSCIKVKNTKFVLIAALSADVVGMLVSVVIWRFMS